MWTPHQANRVFKFKNELLSKIMMQSNLKGIHKINNHFYCLIPVSFRMVLLSSFLSSYTLVPATSRNNFSLSWFLATAS